MKPKVCYYHIYLTDDPGVWTSTFLEQMTRMENSCLLQELDQMNITVITQYDERTQWFKSLFDTTLLKDVPTKITFFQNTFPNDQEMICNLESGNIVSENVAFRKMWYDSQTKDEYVLYCHSKGITAIYRALMVNKPQLFVQYHHGRQYSNWGVLTNWRKCIDALDHGYDVVGVNYQKEYPCFGGNFFWTTSSYIRTLPDPSTLGWWYKKKEESSNAWLKNHATERFKEEQWTLSNKNVKAYDLLTLSVEDNPYDSYLPYSKYATREMNSYEQ